METTKTTYTPKETAKIIRKRLRQTFKGTKFSVTMSRGTGYGWLHCDWTDGPTTDRVEKILSEYENRRFDSMTDSMVHTGDTLYMGEDGPESIDYGLEGVNTQREISQENVQRLRKLLEKHTGARMPNDGGFDPADIGLFVPNRISRFFGGHSKILIRDGYALGLKDALYPLLRRMTLKTF